MDDIPSDVLIALSLIEPEAFLVRTVYGTHKFREGEDKRNKKGKGKDKGNKKGKRKDKGKVQRRNKGKDKDEGGVWRNI